MATANSSVCICVCVGASNENQMASMVIGVKNNPPVDRATIESICRRWFFRGRSSGSGFCELPPTQIRGSLNKLL